MTLRIVFMGTGNLARPAFEALCASKHHVAGLVTQPDRTGRGHHQHVNPLKERAVERGIAVLQPEKINTPESVAALRELQADLHIVAAYGQILSEEVLHLPRLGTINLHASLLPKYRGATPIHMAVLNGDPEAGVTIIQLEPKLDAGPMLGVVRTPIGRKETTGELESRLAELAAPLMLTVVEELEHGTTQPVLQDASLVSRARKFTKTSGLVPWEKSALEVERHVRGMQPWPGSFSYLHQPGKPPLRLQILDVDLVDSRADVSSPGTVIEVAADRLVVATGEAAVAIQRVQPDGKRPMPIADFLRGRTVTRQDHFGEDA